MNCKLLNINGLKSFLYLLGPIVFIIIISQLNWHQIFEVISGAKVHFLFFAFCIQMVSLLLVFKRWSIILSIYEKISYKHIFKASVIGGMYSYFVPAKLGDGFKAPIIKENSSLSYKQIFTSIVLDKIFDIITVIFFAFIGFFCLKNILEIDVGFLVGFSVCIGFIFLGSFFLIKKNQFKLANVFPLIKKTLLVFYEDKHFKGNFFKVLILNLTSYMLSFYAIKLLMLSVGVRINFLLVATIYSVVLFANMLPVSISGIGTRDFSLIFFFEILGYSSKEAIAIAMFDLIIMNYAVFLFLFCFMALNKLKRMAVFNRRFNG